MPARRASSASDNLAIAVAVFAARRADAAADPIVFICGGPGAQCLGHHWADSPLRDARDLIVLDTRGVGASAPSPLCPELGERRIDTLLADLTAEAEIRQRVQDSLACIASLADRGVDLGAYNSTEAAGSSPRSIATRCYSTGSSPRSSPPRMEASP